MNSKIIAEFEKLITQKEHELVSAPPNQRVHKSFSLNQTRRALKLLEKYPTEITADDLPILEAKPGIGKKTIARIAEILKSGRLKEIKKPKTIEKHVDRIEELEQVIGVGPQKAHQLVTEHKIYTVAALKKAVRSGKLEVDHAIAMGLKYFDKYQRKIPRKEITEIDAFIHRQTPFVGRDLFPIICGSYRRGKAHSNDIDLMITHPKIMTKKDLDEKPNLLRKLVTQLKKKQFIVDDLTDKDYENKYMGFARHQKNPVRRLDIRYIPYESYYSALLYFTGSGEFNRKMREHAIALGYKLSEYGLFRRDGEKWIRIPAKSEKDIFDQLGLEYVCPEEREV